ncbi:hypothetical protein ACWCQK_41260 [Streptomyces sp. NPDC002306]
MPQINLTVSGRYLSFAEREEIDLLRVQEMAEYGRSSSGWDRSPSTTSRELSRNAATRGSKFEHRAWAAQ